MDKVTQNILLEMNTHILFSTSLPAYIVCVCFFFSLFKSITTTTYPEHFGLTMVKDGIIGIDSNAIQFHTIACTENVSKYYPRY